MKTERIRVCIGMHGDGRWNAVGWGNASDADLKSAIEDDAGKRPLAYHFVEADVPAPDQPVAIPGIVVPEKGN